MECCPYCCKEEYCIKSGLNRNGTQRYRCQRCKRYFTFKSEIIRRTLRFGAEDQIRAVILHLEGRSLRSIARQMGVHHQTVGKWVASWTQELREKAIKLYLESKSVFDVYLYLPRDVNYRTVSRWIRTALPQSLKEQALSLRLKKTSMPKIKREIGVDDGRTVRKWIEQAKSETVDEG